MSRFDRRFWTRVGAVMMACGTVWLTVVLQVGSRAVVEYYEEELASSEEVVDRRSGISIRPMDMQWAMESVVSEGQEVEATEPDEVPVEQEIKPTEPSVPEIEHEEPQEHQENSGSTPTLKPVTQPVATEAPGETRGEQSVAVESQGPVETEAPTEPDEQIEVQVESTEEPSEQPNNTVDSDYSGETENSLAGSITIEGMGTWELWYGVKQETLDEGKVMLYKNESRPDHLIILAHSYKKLFGTLKDHTAAGNKIDVNIDGETVSFQMATWGYVTDTTVQTNEWLLELYDGDADIVLITCETQDGVKGRWVVYGDRI